MPRRDLGQNSKEVNDILALFSKDSAVPSGILHKDGKVVPVDVQMDSTEATFSTRPAESQQNKNGSGGSSATSRQH